MREISSHFVLPKQSIRRRWAEALPVLLSPTPKIDKIPPGRLGQVFIESHAHLSGRAILASWFCHLSVVLLLLYGPAEIVFSSIQKPADDPSLAHNQIIYYDLRVVHLEKTLPNLSVPGTGGKPGRGHHPTAMARRGGEAFHPRMTLAMNPPKPDSNRETILQPAAPPELKIPKDIKLPNILIGSLASPPKPSLALDIQKPRALQKKYAALPAPNLDQEAVRKPELLRTSLPVLTPNPALPVPELSMPVPRANATAGQKGDAEPSAPAAAEQATLLALSVDPGALGGTLAVPLGNRYGAFSISPAGGRPGTPGGEAGGDAQGGHGGVASGAGDGSSAAGAGNGGGGEGNHAAGAMGLSVSGGTANFSGAASLDAGSHALLGVVTAGQIFPVLAATRVRGLNIQVFTGPTGGGGLAIYRVLPCDKIYTIALPMPKKDWVLQYCTHESSDPPSGAASGEMLSLDQGLVAPDPAAKFDFKRPALPPEDRNKLIVLRGSIGADGSVAGVTVLSGANPAADALAAAAFRRWKFQPALRSGKPVRVEVLVGVPASMP